MSIHGNVRQSDRQGIPGDAQRQTKTFSVAAFRQAWLNPSLTRIKIGAMFGISSLQTWRRAKALGFPPRKMGGRPKQTPDAFIREAWLAGVAAEEIAKRAGISPDTLYSRLPALGLPLRGQGRRAKMTLMEFDHVQLREAMAASARETQAALVLSEMVDGRRDPRCITGKRAA